MKEITDEQLATQSQKPTSEDVTADMMNAIAEALGEAYDCIRVWSAWSYGTMGPNDFLLVAEDWDRLREIGEAVMKVGTPEEIRLRAENTALRERVKRMEEALQYYAKHEKSCDIYVTSDPKDCTCGLIAALKEGE